MSTIPHIRGASRSLSRWTLRTKLLAAVLALFTVVMLVTSALTVLETRRYLYGQLSEDLRSAVTRVGERGGYDLDGDGRVPRGEGRAGAPGGDTVLVLGIGPDGQVVDTPSGRQVNSVVLKDGQDGMLDADDVARVTDEVEGREPVVVQLGGDVGEYLVTARPVPDGGRYIVGVSTEPVQDLLEKLLALVVAGTAIGLVLVGAGGAVVIRRSLAPLDRVAATARQVSALKLDSGDVSLAVRVPEADVDDRTEVGQVGLALNTMLDDVEKALRARQESETRVRRFVADASHELRTPLASIRGYAELTRREQDPVPGTVTHAIGRVESEALRMQELVEDLLLLARLDSGRPLEREPVDLSLLAMNAVSDAHAASPDHAWELDLPDEPVEVTGDGARLHQILANLLANARTHTPAGTRVVTKVRPEGSMVRMSVTDDGPGVPVELQPTVFERFTRGDDSRSRANGSTGLGLSIVAAVGQAHGGRVEVSSHPGDTTFSVLLPTT
ncbi:HAMP domain-containing protein [Phycicoccus sp. CSK15P-2]|uniref:sensor histidine kinase n=1 Tax=Phycicoccus sp. CSK15P-2 TaxID=2807627 RepID=UPI00194FCD21|nr:ATP-binding protein [Phycicoccus sp. CSK15P-2]MBM6403306.1 HAMP domain-containing protein [Phycicoccus sp. CSK15P-2]